MKEVPKTLSEALSLAAEQALEAERLALENEKLVREIEGIHETQIKAASIMRRLLNALGDFNELLSHGVDTKSHYERDRARVLRAIERGGRMGVARNTLTRSFQRLGSEMRDLILRDLERAKQIGVREKGGALRYYLKR